MERVLLGWTDVEISRVGLGLWQVSDAWGLKDYGVVKSIIAKAVELGINFFDTAMVYGNGLSEEFLGRALRELGVKRDDVVVATKIPGQYLSPWDVYRSVERSVRRLGLKYIDLLQVHWPPCWHSIPTCSYARALEKTVEYGLVNYLGLSNFPVELVESFRSCLSKTDIVSLQYRYNLIERWSEAEILPYAEENDLTFLPWSPLARGALTGKYTLENLGELRDFRATDPLFHPVNYRQYQPLLEKLRELADKYGRSPAQIALNWLLYTSENIVVIPGAKKPEHVEDNAASASFRLSYRDWMELRELSDKITIYYSLEYTEH